MYGCPDVPEMAPVFGVMMILFILLCVAVVTLIKVWIWCKLFSKAGHPWALGLLMLVPVANIVMPFILAFGDWPILRELRALRQAKTT